ncbi:solute carrier family 23 protein [Komagataeibacter rhaeticus]|nr:solute carrier family 23 protein [Komagataeibacter rhaeticus]
MGPDHMPDDRGGLLERLFGLKEAGTTVPRECMAGLTTFGAMSYVLIVNPMILATAGLDRHGLVIVTALIAIIGTLIMALWSTPATGDGTGHEQQCHAGTGGDAADGADLSHRLHHDLHQRVPVLCPVVKRVA